MKLTFYATDRTFVDLRPNPSTREWMDQTTESYAYRCLPLNIANAHGWSFHLPFEIRVFWDGGLHVSSLKIRTNGADDASRVCLSNFGHGILTFHVQGVFRTEPGWSLYAGGAPNTPLDGLYPLTGVIETDWAPYSFTMNWLITRPNTWLTFPKGFPFCSIFPVRRDYLEEVEPELRDISSNLDLHEEHEEWGKSRMQFNIALQNKDGDAAKHKWQKNYYQGKTFTTGEQGAADHKTKLRLRDFKDLRLKTS